MHDAAELTCLPHIEIHSDWDVEALNLFYLKLYVDIRDARRAQLRALEQAEQTT